MLPRLHSVREPRRAGDRVTQDVVMLHNWINWGREGIRYLIRASFYHWVWPDQIKWPERMTNLSREVKVNDSRGGGMGRGEGRWGTGCMTCRICEGFLSKVKLHGTVLIPQVVRVCRVLHTITSFSCHLATKLGHTESPW